MNPSTKNKLYILLGLSILVASAYVAHVLWYTDESCNTGGFPGTFVLFLGAAVGFGFACKSYLKKSKWMILIPVLGTLGFFFAFDYCQVYLKRQHIRTDGATTFGIVNFRDEVRRGKSYREEIKYYYDVAGKHYLKYARDEQYILANNIQVGDTLVIEYWKENPHYHTYDVKRSNESVKH